MIDRFLLHCSILFTLLLSPLGKAELEPEVDLERAEELLHCSVMAHQLKWTGYLTMTFAFKAYKPCKHLKEITERNQCSDPIRSLAHKTKRDQRLKIKSVLFVFFCSPIIYVWPIMVTDTN